MPRRILATTVAALSLTLLAVAAPAHAVIKNGGPDDDRLDGTAKRDILRGKQGNDRLFGYAGDDNLIGGTGDDRLKGGPGGDDLVGGGGNDRIVAGFDDVRDYALGLIGDDVIYVWGNDEADGGEGDDLIFATYPSAGMRVDCGPGEDVLILNEEPGPAVGIAGCETVRVQSAG
jgi:Ca2+-binding RTX toxin-like protein